MVFTFIAEAAVETTWWALKKTYDLGYYMIYGHQETTEEKLLKTIEVLRKENEEERKELDKLVEQNNIYILMVKQFAEEKKNKNSQENSL